MPNSLADAASHADSASPAVVQRAAMTAIWARFGPVVAFLLLSAWMAVAVLSPFTPSVPQVGLDASWVAVMGEAADRGWHWGVDLAYTYGPASPLLTRYGNAAYLTHTLPLAIAISVVFAASATLLGTQGRTGPAWIAGLLALGLVAANAASAPDALFLALPLLPVLVRLSPGGSGAGGATLAALTAAAVGATGLTKLSFLVVALPVFAVVDLSALLSRRLPVLLLPFVAGFLVADVAFGQSLADLPAFLRLGGEVVGGYSEAMGLDGSRRELLGFLLAALAVVGLVAGAERRGEARFIMPLCLASTLFLMFKAGFVRQDLHTMIAWNGLALAAALVALARAPHWRPATGGMLLAVAAAGVVAIDMGNAARTADPPGGFGTALGFEQHRLLDAPSDQIDAALALAQDPAGVASDLDEARAAAWRDIAEAHPLPALNGRVDVIPSIQSAVIAAGLDYRPRPSFQEFGTYTEVLSDANRAFIESSAAPDWILFGPESVSGSMTIDHRYSNLAEGALWPDLLRLYEPGQEADGLVALHRRAVPAPPGLAEPTRLTAHLDDEIAIDGGRAVFATVDVRPTLLGRLVGLAFRPVPLVMEVSFADGHRQPYQFISGIGRSGFVVSPLVTDAAGFVALANGEAAPPERRVTSFAIHAPPKLTALIEPDIAVGLQRLTIVPAPRP